jgi:hypothetical protein
MASVQKGTFGVVWSLGTTVAGTGIGTTNQVDSIEYGKEAKTKEITSIDGLTKCLIVHDQTQNITIEVIPSANTLADAKSCNIVPAPGADVTITDTLDTDTNAKVFICMSASKRKTVDGETRITMNLKKWNSTLGTIS